MKGMRILVVEDEFTVAAELADHFRSVGAEVLGPVPCLARAEEYLDRVDAAILDINLNGEMVFPLADVLSERGVPFVFFSGNEEILLPERFRYTPSLSKPANWRKAIQMLVDQQSNGAPRASDIVELLPKLRLAARLYVGDPQSADRLVERTLKAALSDIAEGKDDLGRAEWLSSLMEQVLASAGNEILN